MITDRQLQEIGVFQHGVLSSADIECSDEIRKICESDTCHQYAKSWVCPPAVGTTRQCEERCRSYASAMVFCAVYRLEDSFDYEGMVAGRRAFKRLCEKLNALAKEEYPRYLLLSNGGCDTCKTCTYPQAPCRMPQSLFPALEGYGVNVVALSRKANMNYHNGENTVTYFGVLLY